MKRLIFIRRKKNNAISYIILGGVKLEAYSFKAERILTLFDVFA